MKIRDNVKPSLPPIPGGTYLGICVYSIAIGEQLCEYEGKSKSYNKQVMLGFEICGEHEMWGHLWLCYQKRL